MHSLLSQVNKLFILKIGLTNQYNATYRCELKVYISTDGGANYTLLQTYNSDISNFTEQIIDLEDGIDQTENKSISLS